MFLFTTFVIVFFLSKKGTFTSTFVSLSWVYFTFFYLYPLLLISDESSYYYVGYSHSFNTENLIFAIISAIALIIGFLIPDFYSVFSRKKGSLFADSKSLPSVTVARTHFTKLFYLLLVIIVTYYCLGLLDTNRAISGYDVRSGITQGSWFNLIISICLKACFFAVLFSLIYARKVKSVIALFILDIIYLLTGSTGRSNLTTRILLFTMYVTKIKLRILILSSIFLVIIFLPILLQLKSIIYSISVNSELPNLFDIYLKKPDVEVILGNFGHPLVSLIEVSSLIDNIGFRFFYDYLQGILFYLRVLGIDFGDSLLYYNTEALIGVRESIIPTGYLAFGYVQFGYIGIIISGIFYRLVGRIAEYVYRSFRVESDVIKFQLAFMAASTFYHGEIRVMVITYFIPLLLIYLLRPTKLVRSSQQI